MKKLRAAPHPRQREKQEERVKEHGKIDKCVIEQKWETILSGTDMSIEYVCKRVMRMDVRPTQMDLRERGLSAEEMHNRAVWRQLVGTSTPTYKWENVRWKKKCHRTR